MGAVEKLMAENRGKWRGDSSFGLKHILEKHPDDFKAFGEGEAGVSNTMAL